MSVSGGGTAWSEPASRGQCVRGSLLILRLARDPAGLCPKDRDRSSEFRDVVKWRTSSGRRRHHHHRRQKTQQPLQSMEISFPNLVLKAQARFHGKTTLSQL